MTGNEYLYSSVIFSFLIEHTVNIHLNYKQCMFFGAYTVCMYTIPIEKQIIMTKQDKTIVQMLITKR